MPSPEQRAHQIKWESGTEGKDYILCSLCYKKQRIITNQHLRTKHGGMSLEEYSTHFPDAPIACTAFIEQQRERMHRLGLMTVEEVSEKTGILAITLYKALETGRLAGKIVDRIFWGISIEAIKEAMQAGRMEAR